MSLLSCVGWITEGGDLSQVAGCIGVAVDTTMWRAIAVNLEAPRINGGVRERYLQSSGNRGNRLCRHVQVGGHTSELSSYRTSAGRLRDTRSRLLLGRGLLGMQEKSV